MKGNIVNGFDFNQKTTSLETSVSENRLSENWAFC